MVIDIVVIVFAAVHARSGYRRGLPGSALTFLGFWLPAICAFFLIPYLVVHTTPSIQAMTKLFVALLAGCCGAVYAQVIITKIQDHLAKDFADSTAWHGAFCRFLTGLWVLGFVGALWLAWHPDSATKHSQVISTVSTTLPQLVAPDILGAFLIAPPFTIPAATGEIDESVLTSAPIKRAEASVFCISHQGCGGKSFGTGWVVGSNLLAANAHVAAGSNSFTIEPKDEGQQYRGTLRVFDITNDVAILHTENIKQKPLELRTPKRGETGAAPGFPAMQYRISPLLVEGISRRPFQSAYWDQVVTRELMVLRAYSDKGASGSPIVAADGKAIGMLFGGRFDQSGTAYATPAGPIIEARDKAKVMHEDIDAYDCKS